MIDQDQQRDTADEAETERTAAQEHAAELAAENAAAGVTYEYPESGGIVVYTAPRLTQPAYLRAGDQILCAEPVGHTDTGPCGQWHTITDVAEIRMTVGDHAQTMGVILRMGDFGAIGPAGVDMTMRERIEIDPWNVDTIDRAERVIDRLTVVAGADPTHLQSALSKATDLLRDRAAAAQAGNSNPGGPL